MGKIDHKKLRNELSKRTERYAESVRELYDVALADISKILSDIDYDQSEPFSFESYGKFNKVDEIMTKLEQNVQSVVDSAILNEFRQAYSDCDKVIAEAIGENVSRNIMKAFAPKIASNVASKTFAKEIAKGNITASQRVWNGAVLGQMETAVQESLFEGTSARRMATKLQQFLADPDSCFRRFRISTGVDADGKNAYGRKWKKRVRHSDGSITWKDADPKDYPTGQGIYHSSYKNAFRYARTTTNIAYRTADYNRYQELAFIIGIEIRLSNNPAHISDICDELKGKYPKDFKWTGWHPNCMCYQVPILAKQADLDKMVGSILDGEDPENVEVDNKIEDMPENFVEWLKSNKSRFELADKNSTLPYFLRDNRKRVESILEEVNTEQWIVISQTYNIVTKGSLQSTDSKLFESFKSNPISDFNILHFESDFEKIISEYNDKIISKRLTFSERDISFIYKTKRGIVIDRSFMINSSGEKEVRHELFTLPKELQRKRLSKKIFAKLYDGYKKANIDIISVYANIDQGGYTWARYGFTFWQGKKFLLSLIKSSAKDKKIDCKEAVEIINKWYEKNRETDPFPMNLLTGYEWSKLLLRDIGWGGKLNTDDIVQMNIFKDYLTSK